MKKELGTVFTLGEYKRLNNNLEILEKINDEQYEWLDEFLNNNNYSLKDVFLQIEEACLWVVLNTGKMVTQFKG